MPDYNLRNCAKGKHIYSAGYCIHCFILNEKLTEYEKQQCLMLKKKLEDSAKSKNGGYAKEM